MAEKKTGVCTDAPEAVNEFRAGIYVRLSVEDIRKRDSGSLGNQKRLLQDYINERAYLKLAGIFEDAGRSGTNFERPGFNRLMEAVKSGAVNCILVKDLSRFGRNYIETGDYLEKIFPFLGIRFISVNDGYDSANPECRGRELIVPLKNLVNDIYARDISRKIRSGLAVKRKKGEFSGCMAPYGYLKSEHDGGRLVIDEDTAPVVRNIFKWTLEGAGCTGIAKKLNEARTPSPCHYRFCKGLLKDSRYAGVRYWYKNTVKRIIENPVYAGHMVQGKCKSDLFGGGGTAAVPKEQWVVVENTHEPIISHELFDSVQELRASKQKSYIDRHGGREAAGGKENLLKGLIFCGGCRRYMARRRTDGAGGRKYHFICTTHLEIAEKACAPNRMNEAALFDILLTVIGKQTELAVNLEEIFDGSDGKRDSGGSGDAAESAIYAAERKLARLNGLKSSLYEDYSDKLLGEKEYLLAKTGYEEELKALRLKLEGLTGQKGAHSGNRTENARARAVKNSGQDRFLTDEMIAGLVGKVEVHSDKCISIRLRYRDEFESLYRVGEAGKREGKRCGGKM